MPLNLNYADFSARPVVMEDAEMMLSWRNEPPVREGMFHSRLITLEEQIPWLRKRLEADDCHYYIFQFQGRPTGVFGIYDISVEQGVGEWVYFMGPRYPELPRGAGAAMEFIAMETFYTTLGLRRVWGRTLKSNARVWQLHQRFGFEIEGVLREHVVKDGEIIDMLCVGMLDREWAARRDAQYADIFAPA
jgi:UDP-4-amino-4,6-dideoxy-N-acetyl-beta-L-altrosamine N-acetyltransferase